MNRRGDMPPDKLRHTPDNPDNLTPFLNRLGFEYPFPKYPFLGCQGCQEVSEMPIWRGFFA
jgi:hypothetical protein